MNSIRFGALLWGALTARAQLFTDLPPVALGGGQAESFPALKDMRSAWGDFTGDGNMDVILMGIGPAGPVVRLCKNLGHAGVGPFTRGRTVRLSRFPGLVYAARRIIVAGTGQALLLAPDTNPPAPPPVPPTLTFTGNPSANGFLFTITGRAGQVVTLERTADMSNWTAVETFTLSGGTEVLQVESLVPRSADFSA